MPKKSNAKECSNYCTIALISHASKVMFKILQARLQQCVNQELPHVQAGFRKGRRSRYPIANIHWIIEKAREFQKNTTSALLTTIKPLTVWITTNCGTFLKRWEYQTTSTCHQRNLYADQEATVRTGTMGWFKIGKGVHQGCILLPSLFNLYAKYIMQNTRLDESQAGIKITGGNINNLRTKLVEVTEFQLSYFKSWKIRLWKCCTQYASKFEKLSSGHRTGKGQFSFQSQRKAMPKNAQTTARLHSSHMLVK